MLDKPHTTYVLTEDITTDGTAFRILANGVKLQLDGHTVRYGKDLAYKEPEPTTAWLKSGHGVFFPRYGIGNPVILNGILQEATSKQQTDPNGYGHNPICGNGVSGIEIAAVTFAYEGKDIRGIQLSNSGGAKIHHCIFADAGTHISNRHQGLDAIVGLSGSQIHHNLIRRVRHRAISAGSDSEIHHNEIHCDSWATNAYGVMCYGSKNTQVHHNYIFGGGYHLVRIGTVSNAANVKVHHNHIELTGSTPVARWSEYGDLSGMNGVRTTWGGTNLEYYNNTIIITGSGGSNLRGTWFSSAPDVKGLVFRDNFVRVVALDDKAKVRGAISVCGDYGKPNHAVVVFKNNRIISNVTNVRFGEGYELGCNTRFYGNTFAREGNDPRYKTIRIGYWDKPTTGHVLRDSKFEAGALLDSVAFEARGQRDFSVQWTVTIRAVGPDGKPLAGAEVAIRDKAGEVVFRGRTDSAGQAAAPLTQYLQKPEGRTPHTPHTVEVTLAGYAAATQTVSADEAKAIVVNLHKQ